MVLDQVCEGQREGSSGIQGDRAYIEIAFRLASS
jgi:hypothetical protein